MHFKNNKIIYTMFTTALKTETTAVLIIQFLVIFFYICFDETSICVNTPDVTKLLFICKVASKKVFNET